MCYKLPTVAYSCYVSVKAASMSFALENKHKQSRENIEKTNNNLGKANKPWENKKQKTKKKNNSQRLLAGHPPFPQDFTRIVCFGSFVFFKCFWHPLDPNIALPCLLPQRIFRKSWLGTHPLQRV